MKVTPNAYTRQAMTSIDAGFSGRGPQLKPEDRAPLYARGNDNEPETVSTCRVRLIAGLAALVPAAFVPTPGRAGAISGPVLSDGYTFINFDGPNSGSGAGAGTNANGIANNGAAVGFGIDNAGTFTNFVRKLRWNVHHFEYRLHAPASDR